MMNLWPAKARHKYSASPSNAVYRVESYKNPRKISGITSHQLRWATGCMVLFLLKIAVWDEPGISMCPLKAVAKRHFVAVLQASPERWFSQNHPIKTHEYSIESQKYSVFLVKTIPLLRPWDKPAAGVNDGSLSALGFSKSSLSENRGFATVFFSKQLCLTT